MKSFTDYIAQTKKTYKFKIKLAGDLTNEESSKLKTALEKFSVVNLSQGKSTPIQANPMDFPQMSNINVTIFELETNYPTITPVLSEYISQAISIPLSCVKVYNDADPINDCPCEEKEVITDAHNLVGLNRTMELLKELSKNKHTGEQYTGINDAILASNLPEDTKTEIMDIIQKAGTTSPVGTHQNTIPSPLKGK